MAYKKAWKDLLVICQETLAGTKFDRFWCEGQQRKLFKTRESCEECIAQLAELKAREGMSKDGKVELFAVWLSQVGLTDAEKAEAAAKIAEEEKKTREVVVVDANWSKEDVAMLTKAIVKFPVGTGSRWKVITEFCGRRN